MSIPISSGAAAEKQVDQLQNLVNAIILASIVTILADAAAEKQVAFLGLKTETSGAYGIAASAFFLATLMIGQLFARLADMVNSADPQEAPKILAACSIIDGPSTPSHFSAFVGSPPCMRPLGWGCLCSSGGLH